MARKKLPVGIESFEKIQTLGFYYVDKTNFIVELLQDWGQVNLFTRPRRFGKSLNMDMLRTFFEPGHDRKLFDNLRISQEKDLCEEFMGKFPVVSVSFKDISGPTYEKACLALSSTIGREAARFQYLLDDGRLTMVDKEQYKALIHIQDGLFTMSETVLETSLRTLCEMLSKYYGCGVILLIDEYDVPLDKAFQSGYYDEMVSLIRSLLSNVLKTNPFLQFAVLTGCLRIAKESIFTGLNNLKSYTIADFRYDECFGFTEEEVGQLLDYYGLSGYRDTVKDWYDGYRFGNVPVYCPWDVINYCFDMLGGVQPPKNYWINTSGNDLVRRFIDKADGGTREDIERLIAGETVTKKINMELTYRDLDGKIENLWSVLYMTGYLTRQGCGDGKRMELTVPNMEVRELFVEQIYDWFKETAENDKGKLDGFCRAFPEGDVGTIERMFNDYLWDTISIRDTASRKERKENFYHGILLGLLSSQTSWVVRSNEESGTGYSDILVKVPNGRVGVAIEVKYAEDGRLDKACSEALGQIEEKQYAARLLSDGMQSVVKIGIACYKKSCKAVLG